MLMAWRRHPYGSDEAWISVDVRCQGRGALARPWLFRPGIDVYAAERPKREAVLEAHDLAVALQPAMVLSAIQDALIMQGRPEWADSLHATKHDGLAGPADRAVLADWRVRLADGANMTRLHPVFRHDRGQQLATQFTLDVTRITRADLAHVILMVLDHLVEQAGRLPQLLVPEN